MEEIYDQGLDVRDTVAAELGQRPLTGPHGYEIGLVVMPTPAGPVCGYMIVISRRSPLLSPRYISHGHFIGDARPDERLIKLAVDECLKGLAAAAAKLLHAPANGMPAPLPGGFHG